MPVMLRQCTAGCACCRPWRLDIIRPVAGNSAKQSYVASARGQQTYSCFPDLKNLMQAQKMSHFVLVNEPKLSICTSQHARSATGLSRHSSPAATTALARCTGCECSVSASSAGSAPRSACNHLLPLCRLFVPDDVWVSGRAERGQHRFAELTCAEA